MSKRKHIPLKVQLRAALTQLGLDPDNVQLDHDPALELRPTCSETGDTIPPANDPEFLVWRTVEDHKDKTRGDAKRIAADRRKRRAEVDKAARLAKAREAMEIAVIATSKPRGKSKPMPGSRNSKYKRKMNGEVVLR
ncbi:MAG: hypothetical protein KI785_04445 [Devosiaceae bacterium]|nr:hypothetical protein [Devosiaceae bacterium MH13]